MSISSSVPGDSSTSLRRHIEAVHNISRIVSSTLVSDECLQGILRTAMDGVDAEAGSILLHNERDDSLLFRYVVGEKAAELTGVSVPSDHGLSGKVFQSGKPFLTNTPDQDRHHMSELDIRLHFHTRNIVTVPLQYREGKPIGVMQILNKRTGSFDDDDLGILEIISSVAASALDGILKGDAHSTKATGTGLGTRVVKNAVDAHHGALEGESTEGKGATFRIKLPFPG